MKLSADDEKTLLWIVRTKIVSYLSGKKEDFGADIPDTLKAPCGAFVTLKVQGNLRGCIGLIAAEKPLYETVAEMAVSAASEDRRFAPISPKELDKMSIEISVLSPFETIKNVSEIKIGVHGLYIMKPPYYHGLLLPQVATEYNWDVPTFLKHTCLKAGLPPDAWKEKDTVIQIFSAHVFGEKDK